jgi:hypothetical protein
MTYCIFSDDVCTSLGERPEHMYMIRFGEVEVCWLGYVFMPAAHVYFIRLSACLNCLS